MIASSILLTAHKTCMIDKFPHALMIIIGLVTTAGVLVQWLLPDFYDSNINPLLVYEMLDQWDEAEIGLNGFTYQLGHTSRLIVLGLIVLLFVGDKFKLFANYRILKLVFIFAMMISIFLTSKRMNAAIGLLILVMYYLFYNPSKSYKHYLSLIAFLIVLGLGGNYLVTNAALLVDSPLLGRIAATVMEFSGGQEISSSGRDYIWKQAMLHYNEHPMLGIGISNFKEIEGISVHNTYIQMLCEGGILGFTLMIIPFVWCFISSVKRCLIDKKTRYYPYLLLSLAFQLNFIIEGITDNAIENTTGFIIYAFAISILVDYKNRYNLCKMEEDKRINI